MIRDNKSLRRAVEDLESVDGGPAGEAVRRSLKGVPLDCESCVVAKMLSEDTGLKVRVVSGKAWEVDCRGMSIPSSFVPLGLNLQKLADDFDDGLLEHLVDVVAWGDS